MSDTRHIHFITEGEQSPTLRCRLFGHKWETGTANEEGYDGGEIEADVCVRCMCLKNETWENIASFVLDGGPTDSEC